MTAEPRLYDLVLLGATGFVGRLTAAHLARYAPPELRIALAGRSRERLENLRSELGGRASGWPLEIVDVAEAATVHDLTRSARVLVTTVGPYLHRGLTVVRACASTGTAYADLTGETLFVRHSIDAAHARAQASGARIVHACGFDSVPSDLGVGLTAARAAADGAGGLTDTVLHVRSIRGGVSGGTIDSLRQQLIEVRGDPQLRALVGRPDALLDEPAQRRRPGPRRPLLDRDPGTGIWHGRFALGTFNRQIVQRSHALTGDGYGPAFRYREVLDGGRGPWGAVKAAAVTAGTAAFGAGMWFPPTRAVLDRVLPEPGAGPREATLERGSFTVEVLADTTSGARYATTVGADLDPGYSGTAVMLAESGLSLALDDLPEVAGVLTPMVALGESLAARLRRHDFVVRTARLR